ncbi:MAG: hypothetical protein KME46_21765 [Brasilonema angustatum HA4187-MV1]|jgi:hypothetical protein|nr:hypothetical protein [Brasilonema angustatum HA4187-MV1]
MIDISRHGYNLQEELSQSYYPEYAVWLAQKIDTGEQFVLKEYRYNGAEDEQKMLRELSLEYETLKNLSHPGIPSSHDFFACKDVDASDCGSLFLVIDYMAGESPEEGYALTLLQIESLLKQVLEILQYAQSQTLAQFHHSLNIGDVLIEYVGDGSIKVCVLNFGKIARNPDIPREERWRYDLKCLGSIIIQIITRRSTTYLDVFKRGFSSLHKHITPEFENLLERMITDGFRNAKEAYTAFQTISIIEPVARKVEFPFKLASLASAVMFFSYGAVVKTKDFNAIGGKLTDWRWMITLLAKASAPLYSDTTAGAFFALIAAIVIIIIFGNVQFLVGLVSIVAVLAITWIVCVTLLAILPVAILGIVFVLTLGILVYLAYKFLKEGTTLINGVPERSYYNSNDRLKLTVLGCCLGCATGIFLFTLTTGLLLGHPQRSVCEGLAVFTASGWVLSLEVPKWLYERDKMKHHKAVNLLIRT